MRVALYPLSFGRFSEVLSVPNIRRCSGMLRPSKVANRNEATLPAMLTASSACRGSGFTGRFRSLLVFREVSLGSLFFFTPKGWVCQDHVYPVLVANIPKRRDKAVPWINMRSLHAVQQQVHLRQQERQRLGFTAEDAFFQQYPPMSYGLRLFAQVIEGFDKEPTRAARRVQH